MQRRWGGTASPGYRRRMIIVVDVEDGTISLDEPEVLDAFKVVAEPAADAAAVGAALDAAGAGRVAEEPDHVWVAIVTVRLLAEDQVGDDWAERFDGVVAYARTKGWLDEDGTHIKAHLA